MQSCGSSKNAGCSTAICAYCLVRWTTQAVRLEREVLYKANAAMQLTRTHAIQAGQLDAQRTGAYWLAHTLTFVSERCVLPAIPIEKGPLGIYPRHSRPLDGSTRVTFTSRKSGP